MAPRLELYRAAVVVTALVAAAAGSAFQPGHHIEWAELALIVVLGTAAEQFPLHVSLTTKVSAAAAVFFAAVLILPALQAAAAVAAADVASTLISVSLRTRAARRAPPFHRVAATLAFNAASSYLAVLAGAAVLALSGYRIADGLAPQALLALTATAGTMHVANIAFVSIADGLRTKTSPLRSFAVTNQSIGAPFAVLYAVGGATALLSARFELVPALMVIPTAIVYMSLKRAVQMSRQTIRAVERMAEMVDRRDAYTHQHSERVAAYTALVGRRLGLSREEVELLELAARVHDLGKIGVPDSVLLKPERLTLPEQRQMQAHPRIGYEILAEFREYAKVRELVLTHHERFAGGGYPTGILAGGLPLLAQVIPVADSLDAMTTARPYRGPLPWSAALAELEKGAGTQWNPQVVAAALAVFAGRREAEAQAPALRREPVVAGA